MVNAPTVQEVAGGALVVVGAPGEGRTTLLAAMASAATGWTVRSAPGHTDESEIPYAGLQRLLGRVPDGDLLPKALAAAGLLRAAAPILCLVDDAHLLDPPSWHVLKLAARRLDGAPVAILASVPATAAGYRAAAGLPQLRLAPLDDPAARELLRRRVPDLTDDMATAVLELAAGNPAALSDLAGALTPEQRRGYAPPPVTLPPDSTLLRRLRAELAGLPDRTRDLLLLAAADPDIAGAALADLEPAELAGLVRVDGSVLRFTPALLRTVVYQDAPIGRRRAAHLSLARIRAAQGRRLPSLLHRAAVAARPDERLARELIVASAGAEPRAAAIAQTYAAELCGNPAEASTALLAAARSSWTAGRPQDAGLLLRRVARGVAPASVHARARGLTAELRLRGAPAAARDVLLDVAAELLPSDTAGALDALLLAGEACCRTGDGGRFVVLARRAVAVCRGDEPPALELAFRQVGAVADLLAGADDAAFAQFRSVLAVADRVSDPALLIPAAMAGILVGRDRRAAELATRAAALAENAGFAALVPAALEALAYAELAAGRYDAATAAALDGAAVARRAGRVDVADTHLALLALLAALVGDHATAAHRMRAVGLATADSRALCDWAYALLDLVGGRPGPAAARLAGVVTAPAGRASAPIRVAVIPHLVEAAGSTEPLDDVIAAFDRWAVRTGETPWLALLSRCRALHAADGAAADDHFREALRRHRDDESDFARAHTELLYGRHLRRRRRHREARDHLRRAVETFHRLDAAAWAEQTARELRAAGERPPSAPGRPGPPLTAQQERIAGLVADGATNREVAQQLHLSPRTIDHHLRNVFARLGVRSRTELARLITG